MLGRNEFALRQGFACGKTLIWRKSAAHYVGGLALSGIYTLRTRQKTGCRIHPPGGSWAAVQCAKVAARCYQSGSPQLPCSLGFCLAASATGGARL